MLDHRWLKERMESRQLREGGKGLFLVLLHGLVAQFRLCNYIAVCNKFKATRGKRARERKLIEITFLTVHARFHTTLLLVSYNLDSCCTFFQQLLHMHYTQPFLIRGSLPPKILLRYKLRYLPTHSSQPCNYPKMCVSFAKIQPLINPIKPLP